MTQKKLEVLWNDVFRYVQQIEEEIKRLRKENKDLKIFISNYVDRLEHIIEHGSKKFIIENLNLVIDYMNDYLYEILKGEDK